MRIGLRIIFPIGSQHCINNNLPTCVNSQIQLSFFLWLSSFFLTTPIAAEIKETHKIIEEWIDVETLISEESSTWAIEQASLSDLLESLEKNELVLDEKLAISEEEESGAIQQRTELNERKEKAEKAMETLLKIWKNPKPTRRCSGLAAKSPCGEAVSFLGQVKNRSQNPEGYP